MDSLALNAAAVAVLVALVPALNRLGRWVGERYWRQVTGEGR